MKMNVSKVLKYRGILTSYLVSKRFEILGVDRGKLVIKILCVVLVWKLQVCIYIRDPESRRFKLAVLKHLLPINKTSNGSNLVSRWSLTNLAGAKKRLTSR